MGAGDLDRLVGEKKDFSGLDIVRLLVLGHIGPGGGPSLSSRMASSGAPNLVADETSVVPDVFCPLDQGEVDLVDIHCHWIPRAFSGSGRGQNVGCSVLEFLHSDGCIIELTSLVKPKFVILWFFE